MTQPYDVVVIGAGLAGATAARELAYRGYRPLILEARDRVGGRGWTADWAGGPIEMGGQNVSWLLPHIWSEIHRYGLQIAEVQSFDTYLVLDKDGARRVPGATAATQLGIGFGAYFADQEKVITRPYDPMYDLERIKAVDHMSVQDRYDQLDIPPEAQAWLKPWLTMRCGGSMKFGAHSWMVKFYAAAIYKWSLMLEVSARFRLVEGIGTLIRLMLDDSGAQVLLESPVKHITDDGSMVEVVTVDGRSFAAPVAVVATSGNLWAHIDFASGLSGAKLSASREGLQTPHLTKIWALARGEVDNVYVMRPDGDHPIIHARKDLARPDGTTQILGFSNDPNLDPNDHRRIAELLTETVPLDGEIVEVIAQDWVAEPWTRGGTSLLRPGQMSRLGEIREPEGRIAFAGADIANALPGFDGAVETGIFAARRAHEILKGQSTS